MTVAQYNSAVHMHSDALYRYVYQMCKDEDSANDLVQEAFVKVWHKKDEVPFEKIKAYLFTTVYRLFVDDYRKKSKHEELSEHSHSAHLEHQNQPTPDLNEILHEALNKLPDVQKSAVLLRDYEGYDYKEIGELLNLTESQVKVYLFRARKALKTYLVKLDLIV